MRDTKLFGGRFASGATDGSDQRMGLHHTKSQKALEELIARHVPRDAFMAFEDAYFDGDKKARLRASEFDRGHRRSAIGSIKHFCNNETFHEALEAHGAKPAPLRSTGLVVGRLGIFNIIRLNVPAHKWTNLRRSSTRASLAELNDQIQRKYVQADFFMEPCHIGAATLFVLGVMDGQDENGLAQLTQCMVALPSPSLDSWLYLKPMKEFLKVYDRGSPGGQADKAMPKLKTTTRKRKTGTEDDNGNP
ncbi:hypothetical protein [uncultured Pseudacidovorax sp.]|uniref:hypothetical protein n=1 Tax=uncultured Pseudacidovorax sp. TaxID=679313 RepID=UPI0025E081DF|nr:hypothetical protein [uncultured Pseudacidovorax sp.]